MTTVYIPESPPASPTRPRRMDTAEDEEWVLRVEESPEWAPDSAAAADIADLYCGEDPSFLAFQAEVDQEPTLSQQQTAFELQQAADLKETKELKTPPQPSAESPSFDSSDDEEGDDDDGWWFRADLSQREIRRIRSEIAAADRAVKRRFELCADGIAALREQAAQRGLSLGHYLRETYVTGALWGPFFKSCDSERLWLIRSSMSAAIEMVECERESKLGQPRKAPPVMYDARSGPTPATWSTLMRVFSMVATLHAMSALPVPAVKIAYDPGVYRLIAVACLKLQLNCVAPDAPGHEWDWSNETTRSHCEAFSLPIRSLDSMTREIARLLDLTLPGLTDGMQVREEEQGKGVHPFAVYCTDAATYQLISELGPEDAVDVKQVHEKSARTTRLIEIEQTLIAALTSPSKRFPNSFYSELSDDTFALLWRPLRDQVRALFKPTPAPAPSTEPVSPPAVSKAAHSQPLLAPKPRRIVKLSGLLGDLLPKGSTTVARISGSSVSISVKRQPEAEAEGDVASDRRSRLRRRLCQESLAGVV